MCVCVCVCVCVYIQIVDNSFNGHPILSRCKRHKPLGMNSACKAGILTFHGNLPGI